MIAAATVAIIRDLQHGGIEVCMLRRPAKSAFAPGAVVFPGGAVESSDDDARFADVARGFGERDATRLLTIDSSARPTALAYVVAALREVLEEVGLLIGGSDRVPAQRVAGARRRVLDGAPLAEALAAEGLTVAPQHLTYAGRFITPEGMPRRFDTRFFVVRAPAGQSPDFDIAETAGGGWYAPADILQLSYPTVMPPTRVMCTELARHASVDVAVAAFRTHPLEGIAVSVPAADGGTGARIRPA